MPRPRPVVVTECWRFVTERFSCLFDGLEILLERLERLLLVRCELAPAVLDCFEIIYLFLNAVWIAGGKLLIAPGLEL